LYRINLPKTKIQIYNDFFLNSTGTTKDKE
jgi:hypothetical protein